jgi:CheY-like chemotaxis protein
MRRPRCCTRCMAWGPTSPSRSRRSRERRPEYRSVSGSRSSKCARARGPRRLGRHGAFRGNAGQPRRYRRLGGSAPCGSADCVPDCPGSAYQRRPARLRGGGDGADPDWPGWGADPRDQHLSRPRNARPASPRGPCRPARDRGNAGTRSRLRRHARGQGRRRRLPGDGFPPSGRRQESGVSIGVVVADDQAIVRAGFRLLIDSEPDLTVLGEAADGAEAVAVARKTAPDVVLMDIRMPVMDGIAATRQIATGGDLPRVLILTTLTSTSTCSRRCRRWAAKSIATRACSWRAAPAASRPPPWVGRCSGRGTPARSRSWRRPPMVG